MLERAYQHLSFLVFYLGFKGRKRQTAAKLTPWSTHFECTLEMGLPPEFIDIIGLLVNYKSYLSFYLRYIYSSVCGKYIKPVKPIYELLTLHRPTSFSLVRLIVFFYQIRF